MKTANPFYKAFTADLIPDDGEVGNAFWGYHIANNFSRLMGVEGTCVFSKDPVTGNFLDRHGDNLTDIFQDVPIANLQFNAVPIVQFSVRKPIDFATVIPISDVTGLTLLTEISRDDGQFQVYGGNRDFRFEQPIFDLRYPNGMDAKIGENDEEVMSVRPISFGRYDLSGLDGYYYRFSIISRGKYGTPMGFNGTGENLRIVSSVTTSYTHEDHYFVNPGYVEGYMDQEKLRVRWLSGDSGTVIYKIFGA